jgi:hypothetical protein
MAETIASANEAGLASADSLVDVVNRPRHFRSCPDSRHSLARSVIGRFAGRFCYGRVEPARRDPR